MQDATLVLRDIHQLPAPPWWPPAPGWWLVAALVLSLVAVWLFLARRRQRRRRTIAALFDDTLAQADGSPAQIAAMSELLRRAARRRDHDADRLQGEAWLAFLDAGGKPRSFSEGAGRLLLEGGFRREADPRDVAALRELARTRFLEWMAAK
jgi:hypothetical protein